MVNKPSGGPALKSNLSTTFTGITLLAIYHEVRSQQWLLTYNLTGIRTILGIIHFTDPDKEEGHITIGLVS